MNGIPATRPTPAEIVAGPRLPTDVLHAFLVAVADCYRRLRESVTAADAKGIDERLDQLTLAAAALRFLEPRRAARGQRPQQVAVLGPTQTGKSTVVNLLVGRTVAEVSPLAGFTVHAQGFWIDRQEGESDWTEGLFPALRPCAPEKLSRHELDAYALQAVPAPPPPAELPSCVIWDTPDFDSLAARAYRRGVLEVAALADCVVVVLSKEKYSDLSVWQMLRLLEPLGRPVIVCLNKVAAQTTELLVQSLQQRLATQTPGFHDVPVVPIPFQPAAHALGVGDLPLTAALLRQKVAAGLELAAGQRRGDGVGALLRRHWAEWTEAVRAEHAALREWAERVREALDGMLETYRRDFLEHPQRYDSFRRATLELLALLEIPGLGAALGHVRQIVTWPVRRLLNAGRRLWQRPGGHGGAWRAGGSEEVVLREMIDSLLAALERDALRRCGPGQAGGAVWRAISQRLARLEGPLREVFRDAVARHLEQAAREIQATAGQLYEMLQRRPAVLNTLRAARATTDAAGVAIAIKSGGAPLHDLLFAPAVLALTTMLTEGVLGTYMGRVVEDLKARQFESVREMLVEGVFAEKLGELTVELDEPGLFGLSPEQLHEASAALEGWERFEHA